MRPRRRFYPRQERNDTTSNNRFRLRYRLPLCVIGLSSLQLALSRLGNAVDAQIVVHHFELNPQMGPDGETIVYYLGKNTDAHRSRSPKRRP